MTTNMDTNIGWRELYQAAMLELRPEELQQRIDEAERAILQRFAELRLDDSGSAEESRALDDALRGLRVLASTECKVPQSTVPGVASTEVSS